ncbi:MAG TPA: hypothetical protein VFS05_04660 [Gemmatimonadaceae bacterium]|nr:hypothetical protein [Gemmatimonadaceae bacterium]
MRRLAAPLALLLLSGCVYFNGIYNARHEQKLGESLRRRGMEPAAVEHFRLAAEKAETVLVRHPRSDWRGEALLLAGRGWALADDCGRAEPRLTEYLRLTRDAAGEAARKRERALLALGMCRVRGGLFADARALLDPLRESRQREVAAESRIWAARAAMAMGDADGAVAALRGTSAAVAEWELARAYLARGRFAEAESLLALRARRGDYRPEVLDALALLWREGRADGALRLVELYDRDRVAGMDRARLHAAAADLLLSAGRTAQAREHLALAHRAARDSLVGRDAAARLVQLDVAAPASMADVANLIARARADAAGSELYRRLDDNVIFVQLLAARPDPSGASLFLAGEVARDSLGARGLAHTLFRRVAAEYLSTPIAPKALLAAAAIVPDSAEAYLARLRERYPTSAERHALDGTDGADGPVTAAADSLLAHAWSIGSKAFADTLTALRRDQAAPPVAAAGSPPPPPRPQP